MSREEEEYVVVCEEGKESLWKDIKEEENERRERLRGKVSGEVGERNYMEVEGWDVKGERKCE